MEGQSSWKGISIRGWLALIITGVSFAYFFFATIAVLLLGVSPEAMQIILLIIGLMGTSIGGATGFYFGQKSAETTTPTLAQAEEIVTKAENIVGREPTG